MKTQCLIVDDEPLAIEVIENYLSNFTEIEIAGKCSNAILAMEILSKKKIDLIFLDIQMPKISGLSFISSLKNPPKIILVTAYRDYAVDGFELDVLDYLLKPVSLERFIKAVDKYYSSLILNDNITHFSVPAKDFAERSIFVKSERKMVRIFLDDIYLIESLKEYVIIYKKDKKIITKSSISFFEEFLPHNLFIRIHRSFIIAVSKIEAYSNVSVEVLQKEIPIGRIYKNEILKFLSGI